MDDGLLSLLGWAILYGDRQVDRALKHHFLDLGTLIESAKGGNWADEWDVRDRGIVHVPLARLRQSQGFVSREKLAILLASKRAFPPISVTQSRDGCYHIDDGNHRAAATVLLGRKTILARVYAMRGAPGYDDLPPEND